MIPQKPSQLIRNIKTCIKADIPFMIHGSPGVGKSHIIASIANELKIELEDFRSSLHDPVDLIGAMDVSNDRTVFKRSEFLPENGRGLFFIDELSAENRPAMLAALYSLLYDRKVGRHKLGSGWLPCGAGNKITDRAIAYKLPTALNRRVEHFELVVDVADWTAWALNNGVRLEVIAFIQNRPALLHAFDPKSSENAFKSMLAASILA